MFKMHRDIVYVGWIRTPSEDWRERLRELGVEGKMLWSQETPAFGTFEHCQTTKESLKALYTLVETRELDIQIGGFTGVYKGTDTQVPRRHQVFWTWRNPVNPNFTERHGYIWNPSPDGGYEPIKSHRCPACGAYLRKGISDEFIVHLASSFGMRMHEVKVILEEYPT